MSKYYFKFSITITIDEPGEDAACMAATKLFKEKTAFLMHWTAWKHMMHRPPIDLYTDDQVEI